MSTCAVLSGFTIVDGGYALSYSYSIAINSTAYAINVNPTAGYGSFISLEFTVLFVSNIMQNLMCV